MANLKLPFELEKPSSNEYVTQSSQIGHNGEPLSQALGDLSKLDNISKQSTQSEEQAIVYETDGGVQVGKIDANGADFANLKRGGQQVARMSDLPTKDTSIGDTPSSTHVPTTKAVKEYVDAHSGGDYPIETETTQSEDEEQVWGNDTETQEYVKVGSYGMKSKAYLDMNGNNVIPTKDSSIGNTPSTTHVPTTKAVKDYVDEHGGGTGDLPISKEYTQSDTEEHVWGNDAGTQEYVKIGDYGIKAKKYYDLQGNELSFDKNQYIWNKKFIPSKNLRILDIGNSFTQDATFYLNDLLNAAGITSSSTEAQNIAFYDVIRAGGSFKNWYDIYHDNDSSEVTYTVSKRWGGTTVADIAGTSAGNDGGRFRSLIQNNKWDLIMIHQASSYSADYSQWKTQQVGGYLKEFIRILKTFQPNASIGFLFTHASNQQSSGSTANRFASMAETAKHFTTEYDIDFVIPVGAAIENIRASSANTSSHGFSMDNHHLAKGMGKYVASATYFQALFAPIFGLSIYGNTFRHTITQAEIDAVGSDYVGDLVSVTNDNVGVAQMSVILAISDMYNINNPNDIVL